MPRAVRTLQLGPTRRDLEALLMTIKVMQTGLGVDPYRMHTSTCSQRTNLGRTVNIKFVPSPLTLHARNEGFGMGLGKLAKSSLTFGFTNV